MGKKNHPPLPMLFLPDALHIGRIYEKLFN